MTHSEIDRQAEMASIAKLLGIYFYYSPKNPLFKQCQADLLIAAELILCEAPQEQKTLAIEPQFARALTDSELPYQFSLLFEGQGAMPAPPWGSVYLDKEALLFGESTVDYRQFLNQNGIGFSQHINEPPDQVGLMFMALATLLESKNDHLQSALNAFLNAHFLTWWPLYLNRICDSQISEFYRLLAIVADLFLNQLICEPFYESTNRN